MTPYVQTNNISRALITNYTLTTTMMGRWNSVVDILGSKHIVENRPVDPAIINKYVGDMYGLFKELNVPDSHIYPHIRVNGYVSSSDFYGEILNIKILDQTVLEAYIGLFTLKE